MKKFRLIKTYPGSPELGIICEERNNKSSFCYYYEGEKNLAIQKDQVENQPEYWEKVNDNIWWCVSKKDYQVNYSLFEAWFVYTIESYGPSSLSPLKYFKTKEEAENFVFYNKPCLSYNDIAKYAINFDNIGVYYKVYAEKLKDIIKSRL